MMKNFIFKILYFFSFYYFLSVLQMGESGLLPQLASPSCWTLKFNLSSIGSVTKLAD